MTDRALEFRTATGDTVSVLACDYETNSEVAAKLPAEWVLTGVIDLRS
jgi:hypothetical protein